MKSDEEIKDFVYAAIRGSQLERAATGHLSRRGRPAGSRSEDIVVAVLANEGAGQTQEAYVNVNVYVADQWNARTGGWEPDVVRLRELASLCKFLFALRGGDYRVEPSGSSQHTYPTDARWEDGRTEHFINNRLFLRINNE